MQFLTTSRAVEKLGLCLFLFPVPVSVSNWWGLLADLQISHSPAAAPVTFFLTSAGVIRRLGYNLKGAFGADFSRAGLK